jgi:polysaccharide export outer membrane protein
MFKHHISCFISLIIVLCFVLTGSQAFSEEKKSLEEEKIVTQKAADDYKIGVGDVLQISTWKEEDLTFDKVFVRNDGKITFPLLDDIQAAGRTTMELKQDIQERLAEFVEAPTVTVTLANPGSQKYYILGEVQKVGEYNLIKKLTVVQAFALAEGFTEWASKDEIILFRRHQGEEFMIKIDYDDITDGNLKNDIQLKADDIIIVP